MELSKETEQMLIMKLLGLVGEPLKPGNSIHSEMVGKKVMVRTYSAGVHFGMLVEKEGQQAILKDSRRVYSWQKAATLSQLAMEGSKSVKDCKITMKVDEILLDRVIEVIPMTDMAIENLYGADEWKI